MERTTDFLDHWLAAGRLSAAQHQALTAIVSRRRLSLFVELNALLYLGVLALVGGLAWTARSYSDRWGDLAILLPLSAAVAGCLVYAFRRGAPYSTEKVEPPHLLFDYVLYFGCLLVGVELGYIEYRFHLLQAQWDTYLFASSLLYFALAYRFDNRFVLSLGLATLGSWFGLRMTRLAWFDVSSARVAALTYGVVIAALGGATHTLRIKRHFLETYLHLAANVVLAALAWGAVLSAGVSAWSAAAILASALVVAGGLRFRRFAFVVYGTLWGYLALSRELLRHVDNPIDALGYIVLSAVAVIGGLFVVSRRFGRTE